jgi:hypothetical protein
VKRCACLDLEERETGEIEVQGCSVQIAAKAVEILTLFVEFV